MSTDCRWALVLYKSLALLTVYSLASLSSDLYTQAIIFKLHSHHVPNPQYLGSSGPAPRISGAS